MLPSTQIQGEQQYLKVSNTRAVISKDHVSKDLVPAAASRFDSMFTEVSPFYYHDRLRLSLEVRDEYKADFILIRGLIEFQRPRELAFTYDLKRKLVNIDTDATHSDRLQTFLEAVFASLRYERQFRIALKIVLDFEKRYELERESIYGMLKNSSPATLQGPRN